MSLGVGRVGGSGLVADQAPLMPAAPATGQGCRETLPFPHPSTTAAGRVPGTALRLSLRSLRSAHSRGHPGPEERRIAL